MGHGQIQITVLFLWGFNPTEASTATDMQKKLGISWLIWGSEQQLMHNVVLNAWWIIRIQFQETPSLSTCRGGGRTSLAFAWWALHMRHFSFQSLIWSSLLWLEVVTYIPLAREGADDLYLFGVGSLTSPEMAWLMSATRGVMQASYMHPHVSNLLFVWSGS